ncbi:UNVERIFIED_CONTAM: GDSL esterase/lipase [Sesamum radiatum]|uniref:GDSL esterase/lipase n=1 Tax=Sesamum radiatum TaxID=300843 RepID=A0AAW2UH59_SESRA
MGNLSFCVLCHFLAVVVLQVGSRLCLGKYIPANFVFGDSLVDAGNNNYIFSLSKANFAPNGIDFGQQIGLIGFTPPYLAPSTTGAAILQGVNYASGGGGILNYTGNIFGGRINLDAQMDNFANTRQEIISRIGKVEAKKLFENAVFSITIGSNDFINNYLTPYVSKLEQKLVPPESFVGSMISRFRIQLTRLYDMGARKIIVANVGPIGCIPFQRDINPSTAAGDGCAVFPNQLAQLFNAQLRTLLTQLRANLDQSNFIYADVYHIVHDIIQNYSSYGGNNTKMNPKLGVNKMTG